MESPGSRKNDENGKDKATREEEKFEATRRALRDAIKEDGGKNFGELCNKLLGIVEERVKAIIPYKPVGWREEQDKKEEEKRAKEQTEREEEQKEWEEEQKAEFEKKYKRAPESMQEVQEYAAKECAEKEKKRRQEQKAVYIAAFEAKYSRKPASDDEMWKYVLTGTYFKDQKEAKKKAEEEKRERNREEERKRMYEAMRCDGNEQLLGDLTEEELMHNFLVSRSIVGNDADKTTAAAFGEIEVTEEDDEKKPAAKKEADKNNPASESSNKDSVDCKDANKKTSACVNNAWESCENPIAGFAGFNSTNDGEEEKPAARKEAEKNKSASECSDEDLFLAGRSKRKADEAFAGKISATAAKAASNSREKEDKIGVEDDQVRIPDYKGVAACSSEKCIKAGKLWIELLLAAKDAKVDPTEYTTRPHCEIKEIILALALHDSDKGILLAGDILDADPKMKGYSEGPEIFMAFKAELTESISFKKHIAHFIYKNIRKRVVRNPLYKNKEFYDDGMGGFSNKIHLQSVNAGTLADRIARTAELTGLG